MSGLNLMLVILGCALNIAITVDRERSSDKPRYKNLRLVLGVITLLLVAAIGTATYGENKRSKQQADGREKNLKADISTLKGQNRALGDQLGDCNAGIEAVTAKLHAPRHLKRDISESLTLKESVTTVRNKK
jgi:hypothetical protein